MQGANARSAAIGKPLQFCALMGFAVPYTDLAGESRELEPLLVSAFERLHPLADMVLVEGVGGWAAPLTATLDQRHLVQELRLPVVLVVGMRLGCINHARLSARAIQEDGARLVGWITNEVDPAMARRDENFALLSARMPVPCWGRLPHAPDIDAGQLSRHIAIPL